MTEGQAYFKSQLVTVRWKLIPPGQEVPPMLSHPPSSPGYEPCNRCLRRLDCPPKNSELAIGHFSSTLCISWHLLVNSIATFWGTFFVTWHGVTRLVAFQEDLRFGGEFGHAFGRPEANCLKRGAFKFNNAMLGPKSRFKTSLWLVGVYLNTYNSLLMNVHKILTRWINRFTVPRKIARDWC